MTESTTPLSARLAECAFVLPAHIEGRHVVAGCLLWVESRRRSPVESPLLTNATFIVLSRVTFA
jgi:hypothetical protein